MKHKLPLDFHPSVFCGEIKPSCGEDNWAHVFSQETGFVGVFDGCGGSGARRHKEYDGHSEAFMASRLSSGAVYTGMQVNGSLEMEPEAFAQTVFVPVITDALQANKVTEKKR